MLIEISSESLDRLVRKVQSAAREDVHDLLDAIGQTAEDSARRRILQTKRTPGGEAWKPWSASYAKSRKGKTGSLLYQSGALAQSLTHNVDLGADEVEIGSNMVYARRHLYTRPYLDIDGGLADGRDRDEIMDLASAFLGELLT